MRTKLEAISGFLAGRGEERESIARELLDPTSEASRFLEETRRRSRVLVSEPEGESEPSPASTTSLAASRSLSKSPSISHWGPIAVLSSVVVAVAILGVWTVERRLSHLEIRLAQRQVEALDRIEAAIHQPRPPEPSRDPHEANVDTALRAVEASLDRLEHKPDPAPSTTPRPPLMPDPSLAEIRAELAAVRREVMASESANARQIQELRTILQEVNQVVRRSLSRTQPGAVGGPVPVPVPVPMANPAQLQNLVNNLGNPMSQVRLEAVEQIARLGPNARAAIPNLQQMILRESEPRVRAAAEAAIAIVRGE